MSHSNRNWIGLGLLGVDWHTWMCALSAAHILTYSPFEGVSSFIFQQRLYTSSPCLTGLVVVLGTVITPESLWINPTVESTLIFSPIHLILASAQWRGEKCSMKINPRRSGVPIWGTGYNWGDRVTRNHQMFRIDYDARLTTWADASSQKQTIFNLDAQCK